jgi:hypothetical protein
MIFEEDLVKVSFVDIKNEWKKDIVLDALKERQFDKYEEVFTKWIRILASYRLDKKYFIPLIAKALDLNYNTKSKFQKLIRGIKGNKSEFINKIIPLASKYYEEFQNTGYAIYNILTDFSSNVSEGNCIDQVNSSQVKTGSWLREFQTKIQSDNFDIANYLKGYEDFFDYSFN